MAQIRLNKFLADTGLTSRRGADLLIHDGVVQVNGKTVYELGVRVDPAADRVTVRGKPVKQDLRRAYIMFHKPKNVLTTMSDPEGRPTIADFIRKLPIRLFPVGRLDWDTEGLILLTNDGEFAQKVNHPKFGVTKTYLAKINGHISDEQLSKLKTGISIIGGKSAALEAERVKRGGGQYDWVRLTIDEGRNRQVRQMFEKLGFDVLKLQRVAIGRLKIGSLERGEIADLSDLDLKKIFEMPKELAPEEGPVPRSTNPKRHRPKSVKSRGRDQETQKRSQGSRTPGKARGPSRKRP
jgi:23S rRNA pseudouridine2605 synthase